MLQKCIPYLLLFTLIIGVKAYSQGKYSVVKNHQKVNFFPLGTVKLLPGTLRDIKSKVHSNLLLWDADKLLYWHRKAAGLEPKGLHYGGWENGGSNILGHYLSAVSLMYLTTSDTQLHERLIYIIDELEACQNQSVEGYVFNGMEFLDGFNKIMQGIIEFKEIGPEFPLVNGGNFFYGIHKNLAGLRDAFYATGSAKAKKILIKYVDWIEKFSNSIPDSSFQKILDVEHGGMVEVIADVFAITGQDKYAALAKKFVQRRISEPIGLGLDILHPHHANAKIPQFLGYAHLYNLTGAYALQEYKAASNFYNIVLSAHTLSNGGNSEYERFGPSGQLSQRLGMSSSETCNSYNMLKLSSELYALGGEVKYFDYYERAFFNHILASVNQNGNFCYYLSMKPGWFKTFSTQHNSNWCCVGTGLENPGKYEEKIYAYDEENLYINLFIPSSVNWKEKAFYITQNGDITKGDTINIQVNSYSRKNNLKIRVPNWIASSPVVILNGKKINPEINEGYIYFRNNLKKGDNIRLFFPMSLRIEYTPDNPNAGALLYGPVLLAGQLGKAGLEGKTFEAEDYWGLENYPQLKNIPVLIGDKLNPSSWIIKKPKPELEFILQSANGASVTFKPLAQINDERYSVYWDIFSKSEWDDYVIRKKELIADVINISDSSDEIAHQLSFYESQREIVNFRMGRSLKENGWFSYKVNTSKQQPLFLVVKYWGGGWRQDPFGTLSIFVNNNLIERKNLGAKNKQTLFYDEIYPLSAALVANKYESEIKFVASSDKILGGIYQIKVVTASGLDIKSLITE